MEPAGNRKQLTQVAGIIWWHISETQIKQCINTFINMFVCLGKNLLLRVTIMSQYKKTIRL